MTSTIKKITVGLADDHILPRNTLASLINGFDNCKVVLEVSDGRDLMKNIKRADPPKVLLLYLNMPGMDGFETAAWLKDRFPLVKVLMLTMYDSDHALIRLLELG